MGKPKKASKSRRAHKKPARKGSSTQARRPGAQIGAAVVPRVLGHTARALTRKHLGPAASDVIGTAVTEATEEVGAYVGDVAQDAVEEYGPVVVDAVVETSEAVMDTVGAVWKRCGW
jgi:hypothetical protein